MDFGALERTAPGGTGLPTISEAWRVRGIVQGVGFRYFTLRQAQALNLCGWVRNLPDGSVEVAARGEASLLAQFRDILAIGPRSGKVDALDALPLPAALVETTDFAIR
jgi:acylphosphatase